MLLKGTGSVISQMCFFSLLLFSVLVIFLSIFVYVFNCVIAK